MTVEPMTDAIVDLHESIARAILEENAAGLVGPERSYPAGSMLGLIARLRAAEAARDAALEELAAAEAEADRWFKRAMSAIGKLLADMRVGDLQDAYAEIEKRMTDLVRERDAALARAMPEWKRMATVEEVRSLPEGNFLVADDEMFGGTEAFCRRPGLPSGRPRFFGTTCDRPWADRLFVGAWIRGPLPSLPIPPTED